MKIISYDVEIKSTKINRTFATPKVYTNDLDSVKFEFNILDMIASELTGATATTLLYMRDGSFFQNTDVTLSENTFKYVLKENEGNHGGLAQIQLVVKIGTIEYATQLYSFEIVNGLETKVAVEVMIQDWTTLTRDARAYIDQFVADEAVRQQQFETAEANRVAFFEAAEVNRESAETNRVSVEQSRVTAETGRVNGESSRVSAESGRVSAEQTRVNAENTRKGFYEGFTSELDKKASKLQEGWVAPTMLNGWVNYSETAYVKCGYYKDTLGIVHLRGFIKSGEIDKTIFSLPPGYQPEALSYFPTSSGNTAGTITIASFNGNVTCVHGNNTWVTLNGISFKAHR